MPVFLCFLRFTRDSCLVPRDSNPKEYTSDYAQDDKLQALPTAMRCIPLGFATASAKRQRKLGQTIALLSSRAHALLCRR